MRWSAIQSEPFFQVFYMLLKVHIHLLILPGTFETSTFDLKIDHWNALNRCQLRLQKLVQN